MASQLAEAYVTLSGDSGPLGGALSKAKAMVSSAIGDMASRFAMTGFVFNRLVGIAKEFAMAIADDEEEVIRFEGAVKAAGRGEYFTDMVSKIGAASEATSAFSADAIRAAATMMAPFRSLGDETIGKVLNISRDLTAQFGGDLAGNARRLGMALERPEMAMRMLRGMGILLTATQQQQIQTFIKLGDSASATALLIEIAGSKATGAAEKLSGTLKSLWTRIKTELAEMSETMGAGMIEGMKSFGNASISVLKWFRALLEGESLVGQLARMAAGFLGGAMALGTLGRVLETVKGLIFGTLGPLGWIAAGIVAVASRFVSLGDILGFFSSTWNKIVSALDVSGNLASLRVSFGMFGDVVKQVFAGIGISVDWGKMFSSLSDWIAIATNWFIGFASDVIKTLANLVANADLHWESFALSVETMLLNIVGYFRTNWADATGTVIAFAAMSRAVLEDLFSWVTNEFAIFNDQNKRTMDYWKDVATVGPAKALYNYEAAQAIAEQRQRDRENKKFRTPEELQRIGEQAAAGFLQKDDRARLDAIANRQKQITNDLAVREQKQDEERARLLGDLLEEEEGQFWDEFFKDIEGPKGKPTEGVPGGVAAKEAKAIATGFVGVAEFAKQFQTAILKGESDDAKRTADAAVQLPKKLDDVKGAVEEIGWAD